VTQPPRVAGVLLAAGAARRFGAPKQLASLDGRPLITYALEHMLAVRSLAGVLVVVGAHGGAVAAAVAGHEGARVVACPDWGEGLAASLRTGVAAADAQGADAVLIHLADLPRVTPEVMRLISERALDAAGRLRDEPVRATFDGAPGHPVVLPRGRFGLVARLRGDEGLRSILGGRGTIRVEVGHLADPVDVDLPEHLEALRS
jgi:molybdenum cofactor cytidylyltransferase